MPVHLRLEHDRQLTEVEGSAETRLQVGPLVHAMLHLGVEEAHRVAPRPFRLVHRDVRVLEDGDWRAVGVAGQGDSDAGAVVRHAHRQVVGPTECGEHLLRDGGCRGRRFAAVCS